MPTSKLRSIAEGIGSVMVIDPGPTPSVAVTRVELLTKRRERLKGYRQAARRKTTIAKDTALHKSGTLFGLMAQIGEETRKLAACHPQAPALSGLPEPKPILAMNRFLRLRGKYRSKPFVPDATPASS